MKKKIISGILCILLLSQMALCACGTKEQISGTTIQVEGLDITIYEVAMNEDTKTALIRASYKENGKLPENTDEIEKYMLGSLSLRDLEQKDDRYDATWVGIYDDPAAIEDLSIGGFYVQPGQYVCHLDSIDTIEAEKFEVQMEGNPVEIAVTPYSVSIMASSDWMKEKTYYKVDAKMKDGSTECVEYLPTIGNPYKEDTTYLGGGTLTGVLLEHGGMTILNQIETITIEPLN